MKQNLLLLMGLLVITNRAFSMEEDLVKWFQDTKSTAKSYSPESSFAYFYYGKLIDKPIPPYLNLNSPDRYKEAREIQDEAYSKIRDKGDALQKEKKYAEALTIYKFAPITFAPTIKKIEEMPKSEQVSAEPKDLVKWFQDTESKAINAESSGDSQAFFYYGQLADRPFPSTAPFVIKEIQERARDKIRNKGHELRRDGKYQEALQIYKFAPTFFASQITFVEQDQKSDEAKDLIRWFQEVEKKAKREDPGNRLNEKDWKSMGTLQALLYYGKLVDQPIPAHSAPDPYREAREIQNEAYNKILSKGEELRREKNYEDALLVYKYAPITFADRIQKLEQEKAENTQKQKEYEQKKLKELISYFESAKTFELTGNTDKALELYNYVKNTNLPENPELIALKQKAKKQIEFLTEIKPVLDEAQKLIDEKNYRNALNKLIRIPTDLRNHQKVIDIKNFIEEKIKAVEKQTKKPTRDQLALEEEKKLVKWFQDIKAKAESMESLTAFFYYGQLAEKPIPPHSSPSLYTIAQDIKDEAYNKILFKADELKNKQQYEEALKVYKYAPTAFASRITALENSLLKQEQLKNKSLQQLLQTLIQLTIKLKLIADNITPHAPL